MYRVLVLALFLVCQVFASQAHAWGCEGHEIVAYIADHNLNSGAKQNVADLLSDASNQYIGRNGKPIKHACTDAQLGNIEYFSTWADDIRVTAGTGDWHFWDIPLAKSSAEFPDYCGANGCVVKAVKVQLDILRDPSNGRSDRQKALLYIIHLVGDMHQPMHIVDNGDRGGNCVPVNFEYAGFSKKTLEQKDISTKELNGSYAPNLHAIWDTNMIEVYSGKKKNVDVGSAISSYADYILSNFQNDIGNELGKNIDFGRDDLLFAGWANEAHALAAKSSYQKMPADIPVNPDPHTLKNCQGVSAQFLNLGETADQDFVDNTKPVIEMQLALGGARLANILNTVWP